MKLTTLVEQKNEMKSDVFVTNIDKVTTSNNNYRKVLFTTSMSQLVVMSLKPDEEIGAEVHNGDQFIRVEAGSGTLVIDKKTYTFEQDNAVMIPAGTKHNVINTGSIPMKIYAVYAPPQHEDRVVHKTKADSIKDQEED